MEQQQKSDPRRYLLFSLIFFLISGIFLMTDFNDGLFLDALGGAIILPILFFFLLGLGYLFKFLKWRKSEEFVMGMVSNFHPYY